MDKGEASRSQTFDQAKFFATVSPRIALPAFSLPLAADIVSSAALLNAPGNRSKGPRRAV